MARPEKVFTEKEIKQITVLARCHAPDEEIAAFLGCGESTLKRRFGPLLKEGRLAGKANLRNWQMKLAEEGNATMQIWLGKQLLGQRDKQDVAVDLEGFFTVESPDGTKVRMGMQGPQK